MMVGTLPDPSTNINPGIVGNQYGHYVATYPLGKSSMKDFLNQVEIAATEGRLYYLALGGALMVPDLAGALESANGQATGPRYRRGLILTSPHLIRVLEEQPF